MSEDASRAAIEDQERWQVSRDHLSKRVEKSGRQGFVPFHRDFVYSGSDEEPSPLGRLVAGENDAAGRGGDVRLRLYLTINMMATRAPYDISRDPPSTRAWAQMLALPPRTGGRRIGYNLEWLEEHRFIALERRRGGRPPGIQLLNLTGDGTPLRDPRGGRLWVRVPTSFWAQGWITYLTPVASSLLIILLNHRRQVARKATDTPVYADLFDRERYSLSPDSWTRGRRDLEAAGLIKVSRAPNGSDVTYWRDRNLYLIIDERLDSPPPLQRTARSSAASRS